MFLSVYIKLSVNSGGEGLAMVLRGLGFFWFFFCFF